MIRYLFDTCVVSDFVRREVGTVQRFDQASPEDIAISSMTVMELRYGLVLNPQQASKIEREIKSLLSTVTILPFTSAEADQAAQIRALLKSKGTPIGPYDVLIAVTALQHNLIMVTANQREFERVPGLRLENWRQG